MSEGINAYRGPAWDILSPHCRIILRPSSAQLWVRMLNMLGNRFNGTLSNPAINICSSSLGNESHFWSIPSPEILR
ncbi:hypothetical protein I7I50_11497 [Histoplasma capsulatum G186AR]|uniref:Uncharacterized protein n=1 Tax=Ajellomyces capsulatus TaxID=5037 RepID=A0A8H7ZB84_AJECA|nr:hypothetical protein I7I52_02734 [Histoplasma capsulatum]QSS70007.1 hypothetical protein I7I50_11497 [Histoplasma capsulatum G186AR]